MSSKDQSDGSDARPEAEDREAGEDVAESAANEPPSPDDASDDASGDASEDDDDDGALFDPDDDVEERITLDRYLSKRRPQPKGGWMHIASLVAMLIGLIMIMVYKEQCGRTVSQIFGAGGGDAPRKSIPVRVLAPPASVPAKPPPSR